MQSWELLLQHPYGMEVEPRSLRFRSCDLPTADTLCNSCDGVPGQTLLRVHVLHHRNTLWEEIQIKGRFACVEECGKPLYSLQRSFIHSAAAGGLSWSHCLLLVRLRGAGAAAHTQIWSSLGGTPITDTPDSSAGKCMCLALVSSVPTC